jgi:hypothetical protein
MGSISVLAGAFAAYGEKRAYTVLADRIERALEKGTKVPHPAVCRPPGKYRAAFYLLVWTLAAGVVCLVASKVLGN